MININVPDGIENEAAYIAAAHARISENARKTFYKDHADAGIIAAFIRRGYIGDGRYSDDFIGSLAKAFDTYGKLSPKQCDAVRKMIATSDARRAEWASKQAEIDAKREHIGAVGQKMTLTLTLKKRIELQGASFSYYDTGISDLLIFEDSNANVVIYKGKSDALYNVGEGDTITLTATIKAHGVRNGVKQTIIQRPKLGG